MKAERRQELRTNDLAEQIEQLKAYLRAHSVKIVSVAVAAVGIFVAVAWYTTSRENAVTDGWREFAAIASPSDPGAAPPTPGDQIDRYLALAGQDIDPSLTLAIHLQVGNMARGLLVSPPSGANALVGDEVRDWADIAETAYGAVLSGFPNRTPAVGAAMVALGTIAESKSDFEGARQTYEKIIADERFAKMPFSEEARYRLDRLAEWSEPIVFAPPIVGPLPDPAALNTLPFSSTLLLPPGIPAAAPATPTVTVTPAAKPAATPATPATTTDDDAKKTPSEGEKADKAAATDDAAAAPDKTPDKAAAAPASKTPAKAPAAVPAPKTPAEAPAQAPPKPAATTQPAG